MTKSVGIMTYHGAHNYGSVLQAYAMQSVLKNLGYKPEIINFRKQSQKELYTIFSKVSTKYDLLYNIVRMLFYVDNKNKYNKFEEFITETLNTSGKEYSTSIQLNKEVPIYEAYICGSDQVWNMNCPDYDDAYFLTFAPKDSRKISYAPSFGTTYFSEEIRKKLVDLIDNIDFLSVRESEGARLIQEISNKQANVVVDPTLLLTAADWSKVANDVKYKKPYILCYFLNNNIGNRSYIQSLRERTGFDVVILNDFIKDIIKGYKREFSAGPMDFVGLFKNASFIYTNSFHGTVFSTIFEKPFLTAVSDSVNKTVNNTDSRKLNFLSTIGLTDRTIHNGKELPENLINVDFTAARERIGLLREESLSYLINSLK